MSLPRFGYRLYIACITDAKDPVFARSEPLYRRLVAEMAIGGEVFIPDGSLCERTVQQMFLGVCEKHYVPFTGTLRCGNLRCPVQVFPAPENYCKLVSVMYCIVLYRRRVTIETEVVMTVYSQCWGQINSAHCTALLMYARYVFVWVMCCSWHYSDGMCESVGRALCCMFAVRSLATSFF